MGKCQYVNMGNMKGSIQRRTGYSPADNARPEGVAIVRNRYAARSPRRAIDTPRKRGRVLIWEDGKDGEGRIQKTENRMQNAENRR